MLYRATIVCNFEKNLDSGDETAREDFHVEEEFDEGFDEDPDVVELTPPVDRGAIELAGPGDEDDDDEGFDEEPDWSERGDDSDWERR